MKKALALILIGVLAVGTLAGCGNGKSKANTGKDAIKVNDEMLKSNYLDNRIKQMFTVNQINAEDPMSDYYRASIISGLVNTTLMEQEAKRRDISFGDDEIKTMREQSIASYGDKEKFESMLKEYGLTDADFDQMIREQIYYNKLSDDLKKDIEVDAKAYYDAHPEEFKVEDQVKAAHILVDSQEKADEIIKKLNEGGDFAELAKENSMDSANKDQGGDLGYFVATSMVKPFSDAAFAMEPGTVSTAPVQTEYGFHIIKVEDKKSAHTKTFEEVEASLKDKLVQQELSTKMQTLIQELQGKATIEYMSDEYNPEKLMEKVMQAMQSDQSTQGQGGGNAAAGTEAGTGEQQPAADSSKTNQ